MWQKFLVRSALIVIFVCLLVAIVAYARGYRFNTVDNSVVPTGIMIASSTPDGAKIYVDGELKGATNSNITLNPGQYEVEIVKEGYFPWKQTVVIKGELVARTDAVLFPQNPSLSPLTSLGIIKAHFFDQANKVLLLSESTETATVSARVDGRIIGTDKAGIYLLDHANRPLSLFNSLRLLALKSVFPEVLNFEETEVRLSPDGKEILFTLTRLGSSYLLSLDQEEQVPFNVTRSKQAIIDAWDEKDRKNLQKILETFKDPLPQIATDSFQIISFSPDDSKILYQAKRNTFLPDLINPPLVSTNQTPQIRNIEKDQFYVYDKREDRNYLLELKDGFEPTPTPKNSRNKTTQVPKSVPVENNLIWYPDSNHLIIKDEGRVSVIRYDGTHRQTVYSGPFEQGFLGVTSDGRLLILANLNPQRNKKPDVYAVGIR